MFSFLRKNNVGVTTVMNGKDSYKEFKNKERALDYIGNILFSRNLEVTDVISRTTSEEYYCNDNIRFIVYSL